MCPVYRCPIDETVFQSSKFERAPTLEGHPECPGPACREKFGTESDAGAVVEPVPVTVPIRAAARPAGSAPVPDADAPAPGLATGLQPPPTGQGW